MSGDRPGFDPHYHPPLPAGFSFGTLPAGSVPTATVLDPITAQAARILEYPPPERTWQQGLVLLVITLIMFAATGFFRATPTELALLVAVLLLHESGHYLGMRLFNYQDVKMFFIPFFGAAVSGRRASVEGYKEAIVLLLGPLPGIFLGLALGVVCLFYDSALLRSAALMLIWINGFNLLPLMPLDGGRVLHLIVFSRQRHVEAAFRVVTATLLGLVALSGAWGLGIFAVLLVIATPANFRVSKLAQQLRGAFLSSGDANPAAPLSHELAVALIERVRSGFPKVLQPAALANLARQVWERIHLRPPGLIASILLLGMFGATIVVAPAALVVFHAPLPSIVMERQPDGSQVRTRQVRVWGQLKSSTALNADGERHGKFVEYFPSASQIHVEGAFARDLKDGIWTTYTADGQIESQQEFRLGRPIVPPPPNPR
jgi:Zn-dependent protease